LGKQSSSTLIRTRELPSEDVAEVRFYPGTFARAGVSRRMTMPHRGSAWSAWSPLSLLCVVSCSALVGACGQPEPETAAHKAAPRPLPLRTLRLYETGVGYFERSGTPSDTTAMSLPVPAGHLDDALKSLVVLDGGGGGQVSGVAFSSSVTHATARARAGLPADSDQPIAFKDLLVSMKGELVTVSTRGSAAISTGRVIEVTEELDEAAVSVNGVAASTVLSVGNLADLVPAQGVENGALFVYSVPGPFVLDAHASALVPFLSKPVTTENIAFFGSPTASARTAVRFVNNTGQSQSGLRRAPSRRRRCTTGSRRASR